MRTPLSILDRANTRIVDGQTIDARQVFAEVTRRAQAVEALGYHRFWVAEHHSVPGIAGSAPTLLLPHLASATSTLRLGTGGIMVPSHQPLVIAEQIGTLQSLFGGRLDAGLGASTGFTKPIRAALRQSDDAAQHFGDDVDAVISYLDGTADITVYPADRSATPLYILTGGGAALFAASRGAGLVLGGPAVTNGLKTTGEHSAPAQEYRRHFVTSPHRRQAPWVIASVNIAVAPTRREAEDLLLSEAWAMTHARRSGVFSPLESPAVIRQQSPSQQQQRRIDRVLTSSIYGTPVEVIQQLEAVLNYTGADELLVTGNAWDLTAQSRSDELLIRAWSASPRGSGDFATR